MNKKCKPFMDQLCDALGEDLDSPLCRELREHLDGCPDCSLQIDTVKRTIEIYRSMPGEHVPSDVQNRLLARLNLPPMEKAEESL